ncbi:MAG: bifunctional enoyl-CoA hydratase/phosphate acetyltransferase, partial [Hyphomicrobiales bacterium]
LDAERGLRLPGHRVSHVFITDIPAYPKLLGITDAAINITPDLSAKAQIAQNAIELFHLLGVKVPKVAILSAVETVNPAIISTLDAACLTLMARRGQIGKAEVDGPLAFDNAISAAAASEKGIVSTVAGDADIVLTPDLVSGNILAKNLEYLSGAVAAGVVVGLRVPVALSSRADPPAARLASLALASVMHHRTTRIEVKTATSEPSLHTSPQPEDACCPTPAQTDADICPPRDRSRQHLPGRS